MSAFAWILALNIEVLRETRDHLQEFGIGGLDDKAKK
jgi:hypothetical protein